MKKPKPIKTLMKPDELTAFYKIEISKKNLVENGWKLNSLADLYMVEIKPC